MDAYQKAAFYCAHTKNILLFPINYYFADGITAGDFTIHIEAQLLQQPGYFYLKAINDKEYLHSG